MCISFDVRLDVSVRFGVHLFTCERYSKGEAIEPCLFIKKESPDIDGVICPYSTKLYAQPKYLFG